MAMPKIEIIDLKFLGLEHSIACFVIRTDEGPVLIETGPHSTFGHLEEGLKTLQLTPSDVNHVLLTHIHLDHAGAAWALAEHGAKIYLHPFGARNMEDPSRLMASARQIYQDQMDSLWGDMRPIPSSQLIQVGHEEELEIGGVRFESLHTPGHAKHHIAWKVDDVIFTGDVAGVKIANGPVQPPCPPPDINIEEWLASIQLIKSLNPSTLYLTHFGTITEIDGHFDELEAMLSDWSAFVKLHWEAGKTNEDIVPLFVEHTSGQLQAKGLNEEEVNQYQAANPAWMSVAGLVRYWTKKLNT